MNLGAERPPDAVTEERQDFLHGTEDVKSLEDFRFGVKQEPCPGSIQWSKLNLGGEKPPDAVAVKEDGIFCIESEGGIDLKDS